ncbi:MAG: MarR family transcriptional regulator [Bacteroidales bacterium]|nr:MarR family transcriptional regulator [Bacteroidales bacterium]
MRKENQTHKLADTLICNIEQVARLGRHSASKFFDKNSNLSVSFNDFLILETLFDNPDIHQRNLAKILVRSVANLSRELDRLEKRGLVERTVDVKDRRTVKTLKLSEAGQQVYQKACETCVKQVENIENVFTQKEYETFMNYLFKFKNRLIETCGEVLE